MVILLFFLVLGVSAQNNSTDDCVDDPEGELMENAGQTCVQLLGTGFVFCETDISPFSPPDSVPKGTLLKSFCPLSCNSCGSGRAPEPQPIAIAGCNATEPNATESNDTQGITSTNSTLTGIPGRCIDYDSAGLGVTCSAYIPEDKRVFLTISDGEEVTGFINRANSAAATINNLARNYFRSTASDACFDNWFEWLCRRSFPPCKNVSGVEAPQLMCQSSCDELWQKCGKIFRWLEQNLPRYVTSQTVVPCDRTLSAQNSAEADDFLVPGPDDWPALSGTPNWPLQNYSANISSTGDEVIVPCLALKSNERDACDLSQYECPCDAIVAINERGSDTDCTCGMICALPMWDTLDIGANLMWWRLLLFAYLGPAFLSMPFNILLVKKEWERLSQLSEADRKGAPLLLMAPLIAILFFVVGPLPAVSVRFDMLCNGKNGLQLDFDVNKIGITNVRVEEGWVCMVTKAAPHVLQSFFACVACVLFQLYTQIQASVRMKRFAGSGRHASKMYFVVIVLWPLLNLIVMYALNVDPYTESYDNIMADTMQNQFVCSARFPEVWQEVLVVQVPTILCAIASCFLSILLVHQAKRLTIVADKKAGRNKNSAAISTKTHRLLVTMQRFSAASTLFLVVQLATWLSYIPQANEFSTNIADWIDCTTRGGLAQCSIEAEADPCDYTDDLVPFDTPSCILGLAKDIENGTTICGYEIDESGESKCPQISEFAPSYTLMAFVFAVPSTLPLLFGVLFTWVHLKRYSRRAALYMDSRAISLGFKMHKLRGGALEESTSTNTTHEMNSKASQGTSSKEALSTAGDDRGKIELSLYENPTLACESSFKRESPHASLGDSSTTENGARSGDFSVL